MPIAVRTVGSESSPADIAKVLNEDGCVVIAEPDMSFPWREIEVTRDGPLPLLRLSGTLAERAQRQGWASSSLSLSHAECHAMAVVQVVCGPAIDEPTFIVNGGDSGAGAR
jgi:hypothetical protein